MFVKIDGTIVNLNNVLAIQNADELKHDYSGIGWLKLTVCAFSPDIAGLEYIYFEDKPCVRAAYSYLKSLCGAQVFED